MSAEPPPDLRPDADPLVLEGEISESQAKSYLMLPFVLAAGVARLEIAYSWDPGHDTVIDLGVWDSRGYRDQRGFRGWSGSRQGLIHDGQDAIWIEAEAADRCYSHGPLEPGRWHVELGVGAIARGGARYRVELRALSEAQGRPMPPADQVDRHHVARATAGAFHADMHQHGRHSHPSAPGWEEFVASSRAAQLDVLPVVEYVIERHWDELGPVQRSHPDLLFVPAREVITYFGHLVVHGETPGYIEYRHGFEDVTVSQIQRNAVANDALFQVAHPTIYPEGDFGSYCRGCYFSLGDEVDWYLVDTLEVVTATSYFDKIGITNPFVDTAIDLWHECLRRGHRITAVAGSDDKLGPDFGSAATTILATQLSRPAVSDALRDGKAYVRARGVERSPELTLTATTEDDEQVGFGGTVGAEAELEISVSGASGSTLRVMADGVEVDRVSISADHHTYRRRIDAQPGSGPLGTFWGCEVHDAHALSALANPVFVKPD